MFTLHTYSQAQAAMEQVANLTHDLAQQRLIQLSQAAYTEQRLNALWERLDTMSNRLDGRMGILEARQRMQWGSSSAQISVTTRFFLLSVVAYGYTPALYNSNASAIAGWGIENKVENMCQPSGLFRFCPSCSRLACFG